MVGEEPEVEVGLISRFDAITKSQRRLSYASERFWAMASVRFASSGRQGKRLAKGYSRKLAGTEVSEVRP